MTTDSRTDPTAAEIPFREVRMIRRNLDDIPQFGWPDGFSSRRFADGDMDVWASILSTDKHLETDRALFVTEFGEDIRRIAERMFFVVSPDGKVVGTSTAWEDRDDHGVTVGRLHWVFLLPEYHGRGLAKPLLTETLNLIGRLGHPRCYLVTQLTRLPAINLYLKFGFVPEIRTAEDKDNWKLLSPHISHPAIRDLG